MKRFLVFIGRVYYPSGGMRDFKQDFNSLTDTVPLVNEVVGEAWSWAHVWDSEIRKFVFAVWDGDVLDDGDLAELNGAIQCP